MLIMQHNINVYSQEIVILQTWRTAISEMVPSNRPVPHQYHLFSNKNKKPFLPTMIKLHHVRGDMHVWSDGSIYYVYLYILSGLNRISFDQGQHGLQAAMPFEPQYYVKHQYRKCWSSLTKAGEYY